jgi:hypothetical protein
VTAVAGVPADGSAGRARVDNLVDEIVDKPPSMPGPGVLRLTASTSERFPGGAKPIVEHPNGDDPAIGLRRRSAGPVQRVCESGG